MPWSQTTPMDQKTQFIADYLRETFSFTELCARYGVSRESGYRLVERYLAQGPAGLQERSRRPHTKKDQCRSRFKFPNSGCLRSEVKKPYSARASTKPTAQ